ncbi:D-Ala-D-Ala carboxypeptidase family metallohydrolase [Agrobacterium tumefaciens]|uniref:D-Ala-D-Ala carboxypeptidase family metallohydrolase n=1 Tax=Agrobacterium tumefaciens TaxID=358 RepID=UPI001AEBBB1A|nr:D-Ala-D-Ala carboxypeptidase family metallohydrolase [Agrobacterium tumefaciens]
MDTYVRPAQSPLRQLSEALGTANKGIQTLIETRDKKAEEEQELKGKAAFYTDHAGELAQAITDGTLPAHYSPFYVRGYKNAQGAAAGQNLRTKWQDAWDNWPGKDGEDPEAFNTFFQTFVKDNVGTEDQDVLRGVLPAVEALQANATTQYTQYRHDQTVRGSLTSNGAVISGTVQEGLEDGLVQEKGADYPTIFNRVNKVVADSLAKGDPSGKAVDTFIDVMSAKILETQDPKLLDWFNQKVPGQSYTYGQTPHGLEVKNATINSLETEARQQASALSTKQKAEQERLKDAAQTGIINSIIDTPDAPLSEELLKQAEKNGDPTIRVKARQWREDLSKGVSNPKDVARFYDDVVSGRVPPKRALREALANGVFGTAEDMRAASTFVQSFEDGEDRISKAMGGQVSKQILDAIRQRTMADTMLEMNPLLGISDEGFEAQSDFRQLLTRWIISNPNATQYEIDEQATKFGKQITDRFERVEGEDPKYNRDPSLPFENAFTSRDAASSDGEQQGGDPEVQTWEKAQSITPEQRKKLEQQAQQKGMGYDEYIRSRVLQPKATPQANPTAPKPISFSPDGEDLGGGDRAAQGITQEQASAYIDQAFSQAQQAGMGEDDQTLLLLDLIGKGESDGNYNAVYGNPGNTRDLSRLTLDEIIGHQQEARRRGIPSTAIGKYGFLYKTLRGLKAEMGLSGSEPFTPELQDKMGRMLLNRRGLQAYRAGRISKGTFALALSQEFASLPDPTTGRSFYHGDGLNASRVPRSAVYRALGFAAQPASYSPNPAAHGLARLVRPDPTFPLGTGGNLNFVHKGQETISPTLRTTLTAASQQLGRDLTISSGYRSGNHPVERRKRSGGGEHTRGNAADISMAGMDDSQRADLVRALMAQGVTRFITYTGSPDMLHVDLKRQRSSNGLPYFMHDKSARNLRRAPAWLRAIAEESTSI